MPKPRKPQLPCKGCGGPVSGRRRLYCTPECAGRIHSRWKEDRLKAKNAARRSIARVCKNPDCGNTFTGNPQKLFCSSRCNQLVNHKRPTIEYEREQRAKRTAKNELTAGHCSICGTTTARNSYYRRQELRLLPGEYDLCSRHARGYGAFISWNRYEGGDPDDVFAAYLIRLTFASTTRQKSMVMMKEAFHANKQTQPRQAHYSPQPGS